MRNNKEWSKEEDRKLVMALHNKEGTMQEAFEKASTEVGRSKDACSHRWYSKLKGNVDVVSVTEEFEMEEGSDSSSKEFAREILSVAFEALSEEERREFVKDQLLKLTKS